MPRLRGAPPPGGLKPLSRQPNIVGMTSLWPRSLVGPVVLLAVLAAAVPDARAATVVSGHLPAAGAR
jgi:hypothetical protein